MERIDIYHIVNMRHLLFIKRVAQITDNLVMSNLFKRYSSSGELMDLQLHYGINLDWSIGKIKALSYVSFKTLCANASLNS